MPAVTLTTKDTDDHRCSLARLDQALEAFDRKLQDLELGGPVVLRAIGGFALMKYGIRAEDRAFTVDIDTVTPNFVPAVLDAIHEIAEELGLERDWINNHSVIEESSLDLVESMYQAQWIPDIHHHDYACIDLQLATVPTLTRAKILAADAAEFSGRTQDLPDLFELLRFQGIGSYAEFASRYPDPYEECPNTHAAVREHFAQTHAAIG